MKVSLDLGMESCLHFVLMEIRRQRVFEGRCYGSCEDGLLRSGKLSDQGGHRGSHLLFSNHLENEVQEPGCVPGNKGHPSWRRKERLRLVPFLCLV